MSLSHGGMSLSHGGMSLSRECMYLSHGGMSFSRECMYLSHGGMYLSHGGMSLSRECMYLSHGRTYHSLEGTSPPHKSSRSLQPDGPQFACDYLRTPNPPYRVRRVKGNRTLYRLQTVHLSRLSICRNHCRKRKLAQRAVNDCS